MRGQQGKAHARRYWWKALDTDPERARQVLALIGGLFRVERRAASAPPEERLVARRAEPKPILDGFFAWCEAESGRVLDETPTAKPSTTPSTSVSHSSAF